MRKFKSAIGAFIALTIFSCADQAQAQETLKSPSLHCLWKVEGGSNVVYLLGSVHLLRATNYPLPAVIENAFTNSQIAAFETDVDKMEEPAQQMAMLSKISLPEGQTLRQNLSPEAYNSLSNHADQVGIPMLVLEHFRPAAAIMTLEVVQLMSLGADPQAGVDLHFMSLARKTGKQVIPLETIDFQIGLITNFTRAEEDLMVQKSLEEIDDEKKLYNDMVVAWQTGDSAAVEKMLNKLRDEAPSIFKKLVSDRTASWIPQIEKLLHGPQNAIIIVGAGHLVGPDGLVELLKKKGFKVTQL